MSLSAAVHNFDGKHVADLEAAARDFSSSDATRLAELCESDVANVRVAATWVFKRLCETDRFHGVDSNRCFATVANAPWEAALHLLQSVQYVPEAAAMQSEEILTHIESPKAMVRAWALDAVVRVALVSNAGLPDAKAHVCRALDDGKASVRARARKLASLLDL